MVIGRGMLGATAEALPEAISESPGARQPKFNRDGRQSFPRQMTTMEMAALALPWRFSRGAIHVGPSSISRPSGSSCSAALKVDCSRYRSRIKIRRVSKKISKMGECK